jgi:hypothetical protein
VSELERWTVFIDTFARAFDVEDGVSPYAGASSTDGSRAVEVVPADQLAVERSRALGPVMEAQGERVAEGLREAADRMRGGE